MSVLDSAIKALSPRWAYRREQYRQALAAYEAAVPSRLRKTGVDNSSGDTVVGKGGVNVRGYARQLEQNYDVAKGALDVLVNNIIGPSGINREPQPRNKKGDIHEAFAKELLTLWADWSEKPEVTWQHDYAAMERLACRTWLRDGELLAQFVEGNSPSIQHGTLVPFSLELIEADLLPMDMSDTNKGITQGVERNAWNRPVAYHLYKEHPGDSYRIITDTKRVSADRMLHLKVTHRVNQARGVSAFTAVIRRLEDLKDYEESERIAARVAAALTGYIRRGTFEDYTPPSSGETERTFKMNPGTIFDRLRPGEDVGTIDSNRPSGLLSDFHKAMTRNVASGIGSSYSSLSKDYNGTYSAQRQELVESFSNYQTLTNWFVSQFSRPTWREFIDMAVLSGQLRVPRDLDMRTLYDADFRGPAMPWIDPVKEANANRTLERSGYKSAQQIIRDRGGQPADVMDQISSWRTKADEKGLVFDSDPSKTSGSGSEQTNLIGNDKDDS